MRCMTSPVTNVPEGKARGYKCACVEGRQIKIQDGGVSGPWCSLLRDFLQAIGKDHILYRQHNCESSYKKDVQVPVCPLCNAPIPVKRGELPDIRVGQHIDRDCKSDKAEQRRKKIYTNRCNVKGCKQKELIPVVCDSCRKNFCLKHRHTTDHDCQGFQDSGRAVSNAGAAAILRNKGSNKPSSAARSSGTAASRPANKPQQTMMSSTGRELDRERREREAQRRLQQTGGRQQTRANVGAAQALQAGLSEDEAMALALQQSLADEQAKGQQKPMTQQEQDDLALAQALAASEQEALSQQQRGRQGNQDKNSCAVS
ncbi:zinc finger, AN1-type domain [Branchiostoma belcheri]|nr:zinc finger, AN1-type domain [Branchiostoma belcheri]